MDREDTKHDRMIMSPFASTPCGSGTHSYDLPESRGVNAPPAGDSPPAQPSAPSDNPFSPQFDSSFYDLNPLSERILQRLKQPAFIMPDTEEIGSVGQPTVDDSPDPFDANPVSERILEVLSRDKFDAVFNQESGLLWDSYEDEISSEPDGTALTRSGESLSDIDAPQESEAADAGPAATAQSSGIEKRRSYGKLGLILLLLIVGGAGYYYAAYIDRYVVEASILLLNAGPEQTDRRAWPHRKEIALLTSPKLLKMTAEDHVRTRRAANARRPRGPVSRGMVGDRDAGAIGSENAVLQTDPGKLVKWLSDRLTITGKPSAGLATLRLDGTDPDFLTSVLSTYLARYESYRNSLLKREAAQEKQQAVSTVQAAVSGSVAETDDRLHMVEDRIKGCEFALGLMRSGRGVFRGFVPETDVPGVPSLASFQKKIVELEIKKKALEVRFKPGSRELRSVDMEIAGIRKAMKERIQEHLKFLNNTKTTLLAKRKELETERINRSTPTPHAVPAHEMIADLHKKEMGDGLYLVEKPHIVKKPVLRVAGDYVGAELDKVPGRIEAFLFRSASALNTFPFTCEIGSPNEASTGNAGDRTVSVSEAPVSEVDPHDTNKAVSFTTVMTAMKDKLSAAAGALRDAVRNNDGP